MSSQRTHRIVGVVVFFIAFGIYLKTMAPTVPFWDCGEFIATSYILGVPHPPGAPLFTLVGRLFSLLPLPGEVAARVNLISVLTSALAVLLLYLITVRLIKLWRGEPASFSEKLATCGGGVIAALSLAFSDTFWFNAVEAEVYAPAMFLLMLALWLSLLWLEKHDQPGSLKYLLIIAFIFGIGGGIHILCWLTAPTILLMILLIDPKTLKNPKFWLFGVFLFALGYSTYLSLFIRSGLNPAIDENNPETLRSFIAFLQRKQYGTESIIFSMFSRKASLLGYQIVMFIKYFFQQFPLAFPKVASVFHRVTEDHTPVRVAVPFIPLVLGFAGMYLHGKFDPKRFWPFLVLFLLAGVGLVGYLNMADPQARERDYFFVGAAGIFAIWIGITASVVLNYIGKKLRQPVAACAVGILFLTMPANFLIQHYHSHDRTGDYIAYDYAYNLLQSCEPNGILFTNGDNDTFPLWFLQEVQRVRKDVKVVNLSLLNTPWYIKQLKDNKVPIGLSDEEIEKVSVFYWPEPEEVKVAGLSWKLSAPKSYNLLRIQDIMVVRIIQANKWKLPIYFAVTVSDENRIGLDEYLTMEGMVHNLLKNKHEYPAARMGTNRKIQFNTEKARHNLLEVYQYRGVKDPKVFKDWNTRKLLGNYKFAFLELTEAYLQQRNREAAYQTMKKNEAVLSLGWDEYYRLVDLCRKMGREEEAKGYLEEALFSAQDNPQAISYLAALAEKLGEGDKAVEAYQRLISIAPSAPDGYFGWAMLLKKKGEYRGAVQTLEKLLPLYPEDEQLKKEIDTLRQKAVAQESLKTKE
jgi:tetratricopeptide (TPR) repeat protein